jgi:hypothetical protein
MIEATGFTASNVITSASNFIKIYQMVQQLLMGETQTDRHTDRLVIW